MNKKLLKCALGLALAFVTASSPAAAEERLLIVGDATWGGWSLDRTSVMVKESEDVFTYTGYLTADKEFKFLTEAHWDCPEYRNASTDPYINGAGKLQLNGDDRKFKVAESANYTIVCDLGQMSINVSKAAYQAKPVYHNELYIVGDATAGGWTLSRAVTLSQSQDSPFVFSGKAELKKGGIFKIATNRHADYNEQKFYFRDATDAGKISTDGTDDRQWSVEADGTYLVTVDLDKMTIAIAPTTAEPVVERRLCWYEPADAAQTDEITLYFNAAAGNRALEGYTGTVYISSGIVTADNDNLSGLMHTIGKDETAVPSVYTMVRSKESPDIYSIRLTPEKYYALGADTKIKMLGMHFTSADEKIKAADTDGGTIYVPFRANTGVMWYRPERAAFDNEITLHFDAAAGNAGLKGFDGSVYVHCGLITDESKNKGDWKYSSGWLDNDIRYRMKRSTVNPDQYTLTFTPSEFFGTDDATGVRSMVFVARNSNASVMGKLADGSDIAVDFLNNGSAADRTPLGKVTAWERRGVTLFIESENGFLELTPYNDCTVKVFSRIKGDDTAERKSIAVCATPDCDFNIAEAEGKIILSTASLTVTVDKADSRVSFADANGHTLLSEKGGLDNSARPRTVSFEGMGDTAFYGAGYNGRRINHNGTTLVMNNTQTGGWDNSWQAPHNICVPFVASTSGYGILFDDYYRNARIMPSAEGTSYSSASITPVSYFFVGSTDGSQASVMENYTFLTGRQELPPYWALGYMTSRYGYKSQAEAKEVIQKIKDVNLPVDAIVFDLYWQGEGNSGMGNLDWYKPKFPDAAAMMADFDKQGVKTICITEPYITSSTSNYESFKNKGYFADDNVSGMEWLGAQSVGLIDASNPAAMDAMWEFYKARTAEGMGGWWLDLGEPERHDADSHHAGGTVSQIHNEFGNLWVERVYRGLKEDFADVRPFIMPRAATAGIQRYGAFPWTGDIKRSWGGLQAQVPALVSAGMSGIGYMGSDVGGFSASGTDPELYLRWVEMAVFSPMMRTHSPLDPEPYLECYAGVLPAVRKFINLRYSYLPYTYTLAWENATKGTPLARPINFHDSEGTMSSDAECSDEYLWGRDILVAPVMSPTTSRSIVFPAGKWVDLNDLTSTYEGGTSINYTAAADCLPHFGRKGAFLPRFSQSEYENTRDIDNSRLTVTYLADLDSPEAAHGVLFDDDHVSVSSLSTGAYTLITFEGRNSAEGHEISIAQSGAYKGIPETLTLCFVIPDYTAPVEGVHDNSASYIRYDSRTALDNAEGAGWYLSDDKVLYVKTAHKAQSANTISISGSAGIAGTVSTSGLSLNYVAATKSAAYSVPAGMTGSLAVYDMSGIAHKRAAGLTGSGTCSLAHMAPGFYLGQLDAISNNGNKLSTTVKMTVR